MAKDFIKLEKNLQKNKFYEWLDACPVRWLRLDYDDLYSEFATYKFYADDEMIEEKDY